MAIAFLGCRGWDNGNVLALSTDYSGAHTAQTTAPHTGAYSLRHQATGWIRYPFTGTPNNGSMTAWIWLEGDYSIDNVVWLRFELSSGEFIDLRWDGTNHTFDAYVDGSKVADGTVSPADDWFNVQFYTVVDNSGSIQCLISGQQSINYSGDTLPVGASAEVVYVYLHRQASSGYTYTDDFAWGTGGLLGDCRVDYLAPNADTAVDDWTATAGDSYQCVDEKPANDSDYIYSSVNAEATELDLDAFSGTGKVIKGVSVIGRAKEDVATAEQLELGVDSNGTDDTDTKTMTDGFLYYTYFLENNPDDAAPWEDADIDALKVRVEAVI